MTKYKSETCGSYCGGQTISAEFRLECIPFKALHTQSHAPTTPNSGVARRLTAMVTPPADADQITVYSQDWVSVSLNGRRWRNATRSLHTCPKTCSLFRFLEGKRRWIIPICPYNSMFHTFFRSAAQYLFGIFFHASFFWRVPWQLGKQRSRQKEGEDWQHANWLSSGGFVTVCELYIVQYQKKIAFRLSSWPPILYCYRPKWATDNLGAKLTEQIKSWQRNECVASSGSVDCCCISCTHYVMYLQFIRFSVVTWPPTVYMCVMVI